MHGHAELAGHVACAFADGSAIGFSASGREGASEYPASPAFTTNRRRSATSEAMQPTFVGAWLDQPNEMLGSLKPVEAIKRGQIDLVWQVAEGLRSGAQL